MREGVWGDGGGRRPNAPLESCSVGVCECVYKSTVAEYIAFLVSLTQLMMGVKYAYIPYTFIASML